MINIFINRKNKLAEAEKVFASWAVFLPYALFYLLVSVCFFFNVLPIGYAGLHGVQPWFLLAMVFYWSIFKPKLLPVSLVFFLGIVFDLLMTFPMGLSSVLMITVQFMLKVQRKFLQSQNFVVIWLSFSIVCSICFIIQWLVFSLFFWRVMEFLPVIVNSVLTILLFPFMVLVFHKLRRIITETQQDLMHHE